MRARALTFVIAFACASSAWSEGPGSRLRTVPEVPPPATPAPTSGASEENKRCDALSGKRKERCLLELRSALPDRRTSGPEATGMGSGAGAGASSGTTGGASFGGSAPR